MSLSVLGQTTDTAPWVTTLPPLASPRAHASSPCPNDVPWGLWGSANPVLVLTKFCTTYSLARIRAWTFQPLEQNFLNWQLQNCGVFLHWPFANAISSMFACMTIKAQNSKKKTNKNVVLVNQGLNCIIEHKSILFFFSLKGKFLELKNEKMEKTGMERKCRLLRYSFTRRVIWRNY